MIDLTFAIKATCPLLSAAEISSWSEALQGPMDRNEINTVKRCAAFIGQCSIESSGFRDLIENLDYSASRLTIVWPNRFRTLASAIPYSRHPELLGNYVYANRMGNGPPESGDGYLFRGRGLIMTTGRDEYAQLAHSFGRTPEDMAAWMETYTGAAEAACWNWNALRCNIYADQWELTNMSRRINGGLTGLQDRVDACNRALTALSAAIPVKQQVKTATSTPTPAAPIPAPTALSVQLTADQLMAQEENQLGLNTTNTSGAST